MKRSELIIEIEKLLCNQRRDLNNGSDYANAESILDLIENKGMLPPHSSKIKEVDIIDRWGQWTMKTQYQRVIISEWDDE